MAHNYKSSNDSDSEDSDKSSRYHTDDEYSDEKSEKSKRSSSETSSGEDTVKKNDFESALLASLASLEIAPMGKKKDCAANEKQSTAYKKTKQPKMKKQEKIKDMINPNYATFSATSPSPNQTPTNLYNISNINSTLGTDQTPYYYCLPSPSTWAQSPVSVTNNSFTDSPYSSFDTLINDDSSLHSFVSNISKTNSDSPVLSSSALNLNADIGFYPEIDLDSDFEAEKFEELIRKCDIEENKKTCVFEICSLTMDEFIDSITYKDDNGNS